MFSGTINVYNLNGTKVILLFGITNLYVWFLQIMYSPSGKGFEGSDKPISLAQYIFFALREILKGYNREMQGYEMLDENTENRGEYGDEEVHNPDQIMFQFDNSGNVYQKNAEQGGHAGYNQNVQSANFDNFGQFGAPTGGQNNNNPYYGHAQIEINQNQQDEPQELKYPYEQNNDDLGE